MRASFFLFPCVIALVASLSCASERGITRCGMDHVEAAIVDLQEGRCALAEERCRLALESRVSDRGYNCLGLVLLLCHDDLENARLNFEAALALNPDFAEAHNNLGSVLFRMAERSTQASTGTAASSR